MFQQVTQSSIALGCERATSNGISERRRHIAIGRDGKRHAVAQEQGAEFGGAKLDCLVEHARLLAFQPGNVG